MSFPHDSYQMHGTPVTNSQRVEMKSVYVRMVRLGLEDAILAWPLS